MMRIGEQEQMCYQLSIGADCVIPEIICNPHTLVSINNFNQASSQLSVTTDLRLIEKDLGKGAGLDLFGIKYREKKREGRLPLDALEEEWK